MSYRKCYPYSPVQKLTEKVQSIRFPFLSKQERLSIINQLQTEIIKEAMVIEPGEITTKKVADGVWEARTTTKGFIQIEVAVTAYRELQAIAKLKRFLSGED